jgi:hypothetical protein
MDGRKHPAELDPSWFGHSVGAWEKDTLVIPLRAAPIAKSRSFALES